MDNIVQIQNIIEEKLKKGDIPSSENVNLYFKLKDKKVEKNEYIQKQRDFLNNYFKKASEEEKLLMNNVIFILDIANGEFEKGLMEYIIRGLPLTHYAYLNNEEVKIFMQFITENQLNDEILINALKQLINKYFEYNDIERRSIFVNGLSMLWNSPNMFSNKIWLKIFDDLVDLIHQLIQKEMIEEEMYVHFFTYHIYGNNIQTIDEWQIFNEKIEKPASKLYKSWGKKHNLTKPKKRVASKKRKIALLIDRVVLNSPLMVIYSLFKALMEDIEFKKNYEIYVYSMSYVDKNPDDEYWVNMLKSIGVKYYSNAEKFADYGYYYPHLQKAIDLREKIIEDKIDYLISGFGYDIPNFIFSNRSAPKQIYWSHGNCTSEIENIDLRISHFPQECKDKEWKIFSVPMAEEFLIGNQEDKKRGEILKQSLLEQFGEDTVFLGSIGRLIKIESEEYLQVVSEIMKQNPNTVYLVCGKGNKEKVEKLMEKVGIDLKRVVFTGQVNPHMFGWIIDVYLDTFPLYGGNAVEEIRAKKKCIIRLHNGLKEKIYNGIYNLEKLYIKHGGIKNFFETKGFKKVAPVVSKERYIEMANIFINNSDLRKILEEKNLEDVMHGSALYNKNIDFLKILND